MAHLQYFADDTSVCFGLSFEWHQKSIGSCQFPVDRKVANVLPVIKKSKKDPNSYGPVSLTSVPSIIMEKMMLGVIEKHLKDNSDFGRSQHKLMRERSCYINVHL